MSFRLPLAVLLLALLPSLAEAQRRTSQPARPADMPADMMPPAGKCRVWMDGVSPQQQPAPTDCQSALRQKPANGVVVFGPTTGRQLEVRGFQTHPRPPRADSSARRVPVPTRDSARPAARTKERTPPTPLPARTRTPPRPRPDSVPERPGVERPS